MENVDRAIKSMRGSRKPISIVDKSSRIAIYERGNNSIEFETIAPRSPSILDQNNKHPDKFENRTLRIAADSDELNRGFSPYSYD